MPYHSNVEISKLRLSENGVLFVKLCKLGILEVDPNFRHTHTHTHLTPLKSWLILDAQSIPGWWLGHP